jgi:hypothetical protein
LRRGRRSAASTRGPGELRPIPTTDLVWRLPTYCFPLQNELLEHFRIGSTFGVGSPYNNSRVEKAFNLTGRVFRRYNVAPLKDSSLSHERLDEDAVAWPGFGEGLPFHKPSRKLEALGFRFLNSNQGEGNGIDLAVPAIYHLPFTEPTGSTPK